MGAPKGNELTAEQLQRANEILLKNNEFIVEYIGVAIPEPEAFERYQMALINAVEANKELLPLLSDHFSIEQKQVAPHSEIWALKIIAKTHICRHNPEDEIHKITKAFYNVTT